MLYSEIKELLTSPSEKNLAALQAAYDRCDESLVYIFENIEEPVQLITEMLWWADDADELCEMIESIEVFEQIEEQVLDYADSVELLYKAVVNAETDVNTGNWRIIDNNHIDDILTDELESDPYVLGSFAAWVIADATGWPLSLVEAAQKAEIYQEIGEGMTDEQIKEVARLYAQYDGYGSHFATCDSEEHEIYITESGKRKLKYYLFHI